MTGGGEERYVRIVNGEALDVVGFEVVAPWHELSRVVPVAWRALRARYAEVTNLADDLLVDVSVEQANGVYRQLVGAPVTSVAAVPDGMTVLHVPPQRYVHFRHEGPVREIAASFGAMYEWAAAAGIAVDAFKLDFGYPPGGDGDGDAHELFVRVAPAYAESGRWG